MSLQKLIELSKIEITDEQRKTIYDNYIKSMEKFDKECIERFRCSECGADTLNLSHSFSCSLRGSGF